MGLIPKAQVALTSQRLGHEAYGGGLMQYHPRRNHSISNAPYVDPSVGLNSFDEDVLVGTIVGQHHSAGRHPWCGRCGLQSNTLPRIFVVLET